MRFLILALLTLMRFGEAACPSPIPPLPQLPVPVAVPPPETLCTSVPPAPTQMNGYTPITFVNNSGIHADDIFIVVLVNSSKQYLSFSGGTSKLATISNFTPTTYLSDTTYSYPLSFFEQTSTSPDAYTFYIPNDGNNGKSGTQVMTSSRILISLNERLTYFINNLNVLQFPTEFDATNDNYYILNDKIEFDLGSNNLNRLNLNLTGVDFFGLPLLVQASYKFFFGTIFRDACGLTGMPSTVTFNDVYTQYESALNSLSSPFDTYWRGLHAKYTNPPSNGGAECHLRIFAPATAMGSTQKQTNPSKVTFPTDYFLSKSITPDTCSWFNAVWRGTTLAEDQAYYQNRKPIPYLVLDATTKSGSATAKGYELEDGSFRFVISGGPDSGKTVTFPLPTSSQAFFTGAVSDYAPPIISNASAATNDQVFKVFATSIISGFFPINCQFPNPITINNSYVQGRSSDYFENNALLTKALDGCSCVSNVPWYDFYSRTLLTIGSPNLFYTSAYSDFLGTDGTIVIVNPNTDNAAATITVNIGDCNTGVNFPDLYSDSDAYSATVNPPADATVEFSTSKMGPFMPISNPIMVTGDAFFLQVTYNAGIYQGQSFVTQIAPLAQVFHPILPGQGVVITNGSTTTVNIGASPK